ncbi:hypothetical protein QYE76_048319 [Lolium multiflorum]|uniref:Uncharacterized protein n=1 Tax=Lolium multiflorum TaxID=4521 RepID=A0AAD8Q233_LOLMU|nr:hypothetical protein QYE76_048319 [Lolium multiflorum]
MTVIATDLRLPGTREWVGSMHFSMVHRMGYADDQGATGDDADDGHWAAMKQLLRYVRGTANYGCRYKKEDIAVPTLVGDLAGEVDDRKSTSGIIYSLGSSAVTWASEKQKVVALSSCEA